MEDFLSEKVPNASSHYLIANSEFISFVIFGGLYNMPIGRLSSDVDVRKLMMGEVEFYFNTELLNHRSFIDYCASIESHVGFFENIPKSLVYDKTICDNFSRYFIESVIRLNRTLDL